MGTLRPVQEPLAALGHQGGLRQRCEDPRLPPARSRAVG